MSWYDGQNQVMKIPVESKKSLIYIKVTPIYNFQYKKFRMECFQSSIIEGGHHQVAFLRTHTKKINKKTWHKKL